MKKEKLANVVFYAVLVLLGGVFFYLTWRQINVPVLKHTLPYYSDMPPYMSEGMEGKTELWYAMIGPMIWAFYRLTGTWAGTAVLYAASVSLCHVATILLVRRFLGIVRKKKPSWAENTLSTVSLFVSMLLTPLTFLDEKGWWYRGVASPNVWHNPTTALCRPFSVGVLLCLYQAFAAYQKKMPYRKYLWLNVLCAFLSMWAKPSFLAAFLPAFCLFLLVELIREKGKPFSFYLHIGLSFVPSMAVILYQYLHLYITPQTTGEVESSSVGVGMTHSPIGAVYMVLCSSAFVLLAAFLLYIFRKPLRKTIGLLAIWYALAVAMALFLHETGARVSDGNFGWSFILMLYIFFAWCAAYWFESETKQKVPKGWYHLTQAVFALHLICGLAYFVKILSGGSYY